MRDGIALARAGHPVVGFVHDRFEQAARAQAAGLRINDLRLYVYPQYQPGDSLEGEARKALQAAADFPRLLEQGA